VTRTPLSRSKVKVTRPLYSARPWRLRRLQRSAWERIRCGKVLLRCICSVAREDLGAHGEERGGGGAYCVATCTACFLFVSWPCLLGIGHWATRFLQLLLSSATSSTWSQLRKMGISWDEVEEAAEDRRSWRNRVSQCVFDAGWITNQEPYWGIVLCKDCIFICKSIRYRPHKFWMERPRNFLTLLLPPSAEASSGLSVHLRINP